MTTANMIQAAKDAVTKGTNGQFVPTYAKQYAPNKFLVVVDGQSIKGHALKVTFSPKSGWFIDDANA